MALGVLDTPPCGAERKQSRGATNGGVSWSQSLRRSTSSRGLFKVVPTQSVAKHTALATPQSNIDSRLKRRKLCAVQHADPVFQVSSREVVFPIRSLHPDRRSR